MTDTSPTTPAQDARKFADLVDGARACMMTTVADDGAMHSRPMAPQETTEDGTVWFLAFVDSPKIEQLTTHRDVNLTYVEGETYVSASGRGIVVRDEAKQKELWNDFAEAWFQCEPEDSRVVLIRVEVAGGEYWDSPSKPAQLFGVVKAKVTGQQPDGGDNAKLDVR